MAPFLFDRLPYDNEKAFAPIGLLAGNAMFVCVRKASEIRSYADLIAAAARGQVPTGWSRCRMRVASR